MKTDRHPSAELYLQSYEDTDFYRWKMDLPRRNIRVTKTAEFRRSPDCTSRQLSAQYRHFAMPLIVSGAGCSPTLSLFAVSHISIAASPGSNRSKTNYTHIQLSDLEKRRANANNRAKG
jgi:hypothetical protein